MLPFLLALALAVEPVSSPSGPIISDPARNAAPAFSFAPPSGVGMVQGAPTSTKGIALTCTRASASSCPTPWDTEATVLDLGNDECCISPLGPGGYPALARYGAYTEALLRTSELGNASWADVGTPTVTSNTTVAPNGTLTADTIDDNDGAAFEGRSQSVTVTATAATTLSAYVMAGTGTKLRLSNDGTTCDFTATSTFARYKCADASASGASTSQQVLVGNAVGDTGTIIVWRLNLTQTDRLMPSVDATSAAVNVAATAAQFAAQPCGSMRERSCAALSFWNAGTYAAGGALIWAGASGRPLYKPNGSNALKSYDGTNDLSRNLTWAEQTYRLAAKWSMTATTIYDYTNGTNTTGAHDGTFGFGATTTIDVGYTATMGSVADGWIWDLVLDPNPDHPRCRR